MLTLKRPSMDIALLKSGSDLVVAGYASVELVDKQGDLITRGALKDAFDGFMKSEKYRNVQLAHSNIQVGEVLDSYVDSNGRMWKSECDDTGMFVVVQLRNDIEKAREVAAEIRKGTFVDFQLEDKHSSECESLTTLKAITKRFQKWNCTKLRFVRRELTLKHSSVY